VLGRGRPLAGNAGHKLGHAWTQIISNKIQSAPKFDAGLWQNNNCKVQQLHQDQHEIHTDTLQKPQIAVTVLTGKKLF
jgi:hypothetical protein